MRARWACFAMLAAAAVSAHAEERAVAGARAQENNVADVWIAARRLRKGSVVTCSDLTLQQRDVRRVPRLALPVPCVMTPESVVLRDFAAGDLVRSIDVGPAPDVTFGAPVLVRVSNKGISVTTTAIALADARIGDQIDVRLRRSAQTLKTRVIGPGLVLLLD